MGRYFQRFFPIVLTVIVIGFLCWCWNYLRRPTTLPFHQIRLVHPVQHVEAQQIRQLAWRHIEGGFFSLKIDALKEALLRQPWILSVSIRREWPNTLALAIDEKRPEARWGTNGVISAQGKIFYPPLKSIPVNLPRIIAVGGREKEILENFQKLSDDLQQLDLRIDTLTVTDRGVYQLTLSNGVSVMVGRDHVLERFYRFVRFYPEIEEKSRRKVISVDLRYPNGFAVRRSAE